MRSLTKADKARGVKLQDLGCIVCHNFGIFTPAGIHHIDGQTKKGCHSLTLPLCSNHHQVPCNNKQWISRHGDGLAAFQNAYGSEWLMLEKVNGLINE